MPFRIRAAEIEIEVDTADELREALDKLRATSPELFSEADISFNRVIPPGHLNEHLCLLLSRLNEQQHRALSFMAEHEDGATENELRSHLGLAENALAGMISGLSRAARRLGFNLADIVVRRRGWTANGPVQLYSLTSEARDALDDYDQGAAGSSDDSAGSFAQPTDFSPSVEDILYVMKDKAIRRKEIAEALGVQPCVLDSLLTKENGFEKRSMGWYVHTSQFLMKIPS